MIDLNAIVKRLLGGENLAVEINKSKEQDDNVIRTLNKQDRQNRQERQDRVQAWLTAYLVLQGFSGDERRDVAAKVIAFADARPPEAAVRSWGAIRENYDRLYKQCADVAPRKNNGELRDVTSLTSKALWCCYPKVVPMFDNHAEQGVHVLRQLMHLNPPSAEHRYHRFAMVWLDLYARVKPVTEKADLRGYPYPRRVFDKILWMVGQPKYKHIVFPSP